MFQILSSDRKLHPAVQCSLSALVLILMVATTRQMGLENPYLPLAVAGASAFFLRVDSSVREKAVWAVVSAAFLFLMHSPFRDWTTIIASGLAALGFGAFALLSMRGIWRTGIKRSAALAQLGPATLVVFFVLSAQHALGVANLLHPNSYDLYLFTLDGSLGFQPSFLVGRIMASSRIIHILLLMVYLSLPLYLAVIYAMRLPRNTRRLSWDVIAMMMLAGFAGWSFYNIVPAAGPVFCFPNQFPGSPLPYHSLSRLFLEPIPMDPSIPRNAIPSLHMAWVLLLLWCSRGLSTGWRWVAVAYSVLTAFATLGTGEHYFIDLVVSLPFALLIRGIVAPAISLRLKMLAIAFGGTVTLGWLLLVLYGTRWMLISPAIPWSLIVLTAISVWMLERKIFIQTVTTAEESLPTPLASWATGQV